MELRADLTIFEICQNNDDATKSTENILIGTGLDSIIYSMISVLV